MKEEMLNLSKKIGQSANAIERLNRIIASCEENVKDIQKEIAEYQETLALEKATLNELMDALESMRQEEA